MTDKKRSRTVNESDVECPIYRVLQPVILSSTRQMYMPGAIVDLSHLTPEQRQYFVKRGLYETAEGEPENVPQPYNIIKGVKR